MYKHERITIVILSYVIGFSTAFIAFNFVNPGYINYQSEAPVKVTKSEKSVALNIAEDNRPSSAFYEEKIDGLYALVEGNSRILSAQAISATEPVEGFHYAVHNTNVSPSGNFIHYCSQQTETDTDCNHYIYEFASDSTYRVELPNGDQLATPIAENVTEWLPGDILTTEGYIAASGLKPWELFAKPQP